MMGFEDDVEPQGFTPAKGKKTYYQWARPKWATIFGNTYGIYRSSEITENSYGQPVLHPPQLGLVYRYSDTQYEFRIPARLFPELTNAIKHIDKICEQMDRKEIRIEDNTIYRGSEMIARVVA